MKQKTKLTQISAALVAGLTTLLTSYALQAAPSQKALEKRSKPVQVQSDDISISGSTTTIELGRQAWLDDDPEAIWQKSPGVYKEGDTWYVIFHAAAGDHNVKLYGDFTNGEEDAIKLTPTPDGKFWWFKGTDASFARPPQHGDHYRFSLIRNNKITMQDPAARWVTHSGLDNGWSRIYLSDAYQWQSTDWQRPQQSDLNIYQLHPLRFTNRNNGQALEQVREELDGDGYNDYINNLGVTAIQMLPINEFAGDLSWGYNPSFYYAVESSFGGPDALKALVDDAHKNGIAVILDVEFNHVATGDNILSQVDHETYMDGETVWGPLYNFNSDVAKHFIVQNMLYLAQEFKIDGFRFDHTNTIHNVDSYFVTEKGDGGGWQFLREIYGNVKALDENIWFTAEELPDWWGITADDIGEEVAGTVHAPMDSQWVDIFHDRFKDVLKGGHLDNLFQVFSEFGDGWQDATVYTESHDEVGNLDERIAKVARDGRGYEMDQIALAGTIMARGTPMTFMGQEGGETTQFHIDWWDDRLPLTEYETDEIRSKSLNWYKKLNEIRSQDSLALSSGSSRVEYIHDYNGIAAFSRADGEYLVIMNFKGTDWYNYDIGIDGGYREIANTSWPQFNVSGGPEVSFGGWDAHYFSSFNIPAYGVVILKREYIEPPIPQVDIHFSCYNGETEWGQNVYVVGNISELGGWNTLQALKLSADNYPTWSGTLYGVDAGTEIEWKCIKQDLGDVIWQSGSNNYYLAPQSGEGSTAASF